MDIDFLFSYKTGTGFLHKSNVLVKIVLLIFISFSLFWIPPLICLVYFVTCFFIFFVNGISFKRQLLDIKQIFPYIFMLLTVSAFTYFLGNKKEAIETLFFILKLITSMQTASLFFNTTSVMEIKEQLDKVLPDRICTFVVLFFVFIPMTFNIWNALNRTWKSRLGKNSILKLFILLPVFILESVYKAEKVLYALKNRKSYL